MDTPNAIERHTRKVEMAKNIHIDVQRHRVVKIAEIIAHVEYLPPVLRLEVHKATLIAIDELRETLASMIGALEQQIEEQG